MIIIWAIHKHKLDDIGKHMGHHQLKMSTDSSSTRKRSYYLEIIASLLFLTLLFRLAHPIAKSLPTLPGVQPTTAFLPDEPGPLREKPREHVANADVVVICKERCCSRRTGNIVSALQLQAGVADVHVVHQCAREDNLKIKLGVKQTFCRNGLGSCLHGVLSRPGRTSYVTTDEFATSREKAEIGLADMRIGPVLRGLEIGTGKVWKRWDEVVPIVRHCFVDRDSERFETCAVVCRDDKRDGAVEGRVCAVETVDLDDGLQVRMVRLRGAETMEDE